ncbi:UNVERIFIED_CONTAM: Ribonuclease H2 subunit B [Sesamum indicum]
MAWREGANETRVLIAQDLSTLGKHLGKFLSLRHPRTGNTTCYLYSDGGLQELHWLNQSYGSWFLGDYVCEDGRLYTATPVDPVFILLPIFEEARMKKGNDPGKFRQLDEIIYIHGYPGYQSLSSIAEKTMQVVCDLKEVGSTKFFRLNDLKVLKWLCYKLCDPSQSYLPHYDNKSLPDLYRKLHNNVGELALSIQNNAYPPRWLYIMFGMERFHQGTSMFTSSTWIFRHVFDAVSIVGEYLKDEPWVNLLCNKLKLNLQDWTKAEDTETLPPSTGSGPASFNPVKENNGIDRKVVRSTRQAKKARVEKDIQNIKEMFSRVTRKKG